MVWSDTCSIPMDQKPYAKVHVTSKAVGPHLTHTRSPYMTYVANLIQPLPSWRLIKTIGRWPRLGKATKHDPDEFYLSFTNCK